MTWFFCARAQKNQKGNPGHRILFASRLVLVRAAHKNQE